MIEPQVTSSPTILVLRDANAAQDSILGALLKDRRVIRASSVEEALTILEHNDLDLALVDERVDGVRAAEVCEALRNGEANRDIPVLLLGANESSERLAAFAAGADGLVTLPLDSVLAQAQIDAVLKLDRYATRRRLSERLDTVEAELGRLRESDSATGLPNAAMFESNLAQELARAERAGYAVGVLVVELSNYDQLRTVCDQATLDRLMRGIGDRLSGAVRGRAFVGRLDSRNLVLCQPLPRVEEMTRAVYRYRRVLLEPYTVAGQNFELECAIGGSVYPADADEADRLISLASSAMSHARHLGRNKYHLFDPAARAEAQRRLELESQIRSAIAADGTLLHYQPRLRLGDGAVTGVEALLRLRDSDGKLLSPTVFMSVAEDSGLMERLGLWALEQACADADVLRQAGFDLPIAVNVAGDLFIKDTFRDDVVEMLNNNGIEGDRLELELSERALHATRHGSLDALKARMAGIQDVGIRISLDNFGSGQTSLNELSQLSVDNLKLSHNLIGPIPEDARSTAFTQSLLGLGKSLDMCVIAQGVETPEQMTALREMGCDEAQGYLFARPMPMDQLQVTLRALISTWESAYGRSHTAQTG